MEKISSYVVEYSLDRQRYASRVFRGYGVALNESKTHLRRGATKVVIRGFDRAGHCILQNIIDEGALNPLLN